MLQFLTQGIFFKFLDQKIFLEFDPLSVKNIEQLCLSRKTALMSFQNKFIKLDHRQFSPVSELNKAALTYATILITFLI